MKISRSHSRAIYAALILVAFFIPAYGNISAIGFLKLAVHSVNNDAELNLFDLVVVSIPLLLVPFAAVIILFRSLRKKALTNLLLGLPFFSLAFFVLLVSFDANREIGASGIVSLLKGMSIGFYLTALASLLLLFSQSRREALDTGSHRW